MPGQNEGDDQDHDQRNDHKRAHQSIYEAFPLREIAWLEIHRQDMPIWSNIYHWADEFSRRCVNSRECKLQHSHVEPPSNSGAAFRAKMPWYLFQGVHQDTPTMMFAHSLAINCHLKMLRSSAAPVGRGWIWRSMQNHQQFWRHKSNFQCTASMWALLCLMFH